MNEEIASLADALVKRLFLEIEVSGRHVHLTEAQANILFGHPLRAERPLSQPGQYLSRERVTIIGRKGEFHNVAVLGPERSRAQVEISLTDARTLGVTPPVRPSGDTTDSPGITLVGPCGRIALDEGVIAAQRHIHMTPHDAKRWCVADRDRVRLAVYTDRPLVFDDVLVRVSPDYATVVHLDYDEANACDLKTGDLGRIVP